MYFYGYFETNVLINFFILPRWTESITWQDFFPAIKRDPGSSKEESRLAGMKLVACNRRMSFMKSL